MLPFQWMFLNTNSVIRAAARKKIMIEAMSMKKLMTGADGPWLNSLPGY